MMSLHILLASSDSENQKFGKLGFYLCQLNSFPKIVSLTVNLHCLAGLSILFEEWKTNLMSLAILFQFLCAQYVSDINISIIRSLQLCC